MDFIEKLRNGWKEGKFLCIGLDPVLENLPKNSKGNFFEFNKAIIDQTADLVLAYKPNSAFYEAEGEKGLHFLKQTIDYIKTKYPQIAVILDAKRADIDSTNEGYVKFAFDYLEADAITVHPYLGKEALSPFLKRKDKGILVLAKTSNSGAGEFQDLKLANKPLYLHVAKKVASNWNTNKNVGFVVGATYPKELFEIRTVVGDMPILILGIGAQGGDLKNTLSAGLTKNGDGIILSASRSIIFASQKSDFAKKARSEVEKLDKEIKEYTLKNGVVSKYNDEVLKILSDIGAIITDDHFVYTSGKHGSVYIRKDKLYPDTELTSKVSFFIASDVKDLSIDVVVGPSVGGIILSHWIASHLSKLRNKNVLSVFTEKEDGIQVFKRGYDKLVKGRKTLVVEDLTTTGGSVKSVVEETKKAGGKVVGVYVLLNRNPIGVNQNFMNAPFFSLATLPAQAYDEEECPLCREGRPINTEVGHGKDYLSHKK